DECGDERAGVADDERLTHEPVGAETVLEWRRGDVLPAGGDKQFLLSPRDPQEPVLVEGADVAGPEPAVVIERTDGGELVAPVALEDLWTLGQDLAVLGDSDRRAGERRADRSRLPCIRPVDGQRGAGLRETVTLQDLDADAVEEVREPSAERGTTAEREPQPSAEDLLQPPVHQRLKDCVSDGGEEVASPRRPVLGPANGDVDRFVEDASAPLDIGFVLRRVEDLLEYPRHGNH